MLLIDIEIKSEIQTDTRRPRDRQIDTKRQ